MRISQSRPLLVKSDFAHINNIIKSGHIAQGKYVRQLQELFARRLKLRYVYATANGTAALHLSLLSLGVGSGDEVIAPSYSCCALINAISYTGATPVLCDIDPQTLNLIYDTVKPKITCRTKAVIVTHTFGFPAQTDKILKLGIPLIEDCAHAVGATYKGKEVGSFGKIAVFSFYATKMLTSGEGGMVCTNDKKIAGVIRDLISYDMRDTYAVRYNYKMSDLTAGLALSQAKKINSFIKQRRRIAGLYWKEFCKFPVNFQKAISESHPSYYRFIIFTPYANTVIQRAQKESIGCDKPIYKPLHRYFSSESNSGFMATEQAFRNAVSIPLYPALTQRSIKKVVRVMKDILGGVCPNQAHFIR